MNFLFKRDTKQSEQKKNKEKKNKYGTVQISHTMFGMMFTWLWRDRP